MATWLVWFLIGMGFLLAELALPGFILIFFCVGSLFAALAVALTGCGLEWQIAVFLGTSLIALFTLRKVFMRTFKGKAKASTDKEMSERDLGKPATVTKRITPPALGEIKFRGSFWRASADTIVEPGATVRIVGVDDDDGLTYRVKPTGGDND